MESGGIKMDTGYKCAICGAAVSKVFSDKGTSAFEFVRNCEHIKAPIVADMAATCAGQGGLK